MLAVINRSIRELCEHLEIDQAVLYAMSARGWQFVAGPVTMWLIARHFSAEVQGYFYTFGSVLAMQLFFELGLQTVLVNLISHEWASLRLSDPGEISGDSTAAARLASLIRFVDRWYTAFAVLFVAGCGISGYLFFAAKQSDISWQIPWWFLVVMAGVSFRFTPCFAVLEGCGEIRRVNRMRLFQAICGNLAVWAAIIIGGQLWACVAAATVRLFWEFMLVGTRFHQIRRGLSRFASDGGINWGQDVWPLQWRIAIQSISLWFAMHLFTLVTFHYHGEAEGGRMGMTWSIATAIQTAAMAWVQTRVPVFGTLIAKRDIPSLDQLFRRMVIFSLAFIGLTASAAIMAVLCLNYAHSHYAERILRPLPTALLFVGIGVNHVMFCQAAYVRAHRMDPFLLLTTAVNLLTGLGVWVLGRSFGAIGAISAWLAILTLLYLPLHTVIWVRMRREQHS